MRLDDMVEQLVEVEELHGQFTLNHKGVFEGSEDHLVAVRVSETKKNGHLLPGRPHLKWFNTRASTFVSIMLRER